MQRRHQRGGDCLPQRDLWLLQPGFIREGQERKTDEGSEQEVYESFCPHRLSEVTGKQESAGGRAGGRRHCAEDLPNGRGRHERHADSAGSEPEKDTHTRPVEKQAWGVS